MRIVARAKKHGAQFKVLRPFRLNGKTTEINSTVTIEDEIFAVGLCQKGTIIPDDLPAVGEYISTRAFTLPGRDAAFSCEVLEKIELLREQALPLLLDGSIIPANENQWRPYGRKLRELKKK